VERRKIFKTLVTLEEAINRLYEHFSPRPVGVEDVRLEEALGRVLAEDVYSNVDVPPFDRAAMDGYAVRAEDTYRAREDRPVKLRIVGRIKAGEVPSIYVNRGEATEISTGAPMPGGANAVVMVENTEEKDGYVYIYKPVAPMENVQPTGSDIMMGEMVLRKGQLLTPRELGVLAAIGRTRVVVYRRPKVAVFSIGDEIVSPGSRLEPGKIFDINATTICAAVRECGGDPLFLGIAHDDADEIITKIREGLRIADIVISSGSTSAGVKDILYEIVGKLGSPGILVHGIKLKPGKPTLIGVIDGKPYFGLPGYPTSALMIFWQVVAPVIRKMCGLREEERLSVRARLSYKVYPQRGRRNLIPVSLVSRNGELIAVPTPGGSGSITALANADGYMDIPEGVEYLDPGETVNVKMFSSIITAPDLVIIGSNCAGIGLILELITEMYEFLNIRVLNVGSMGGIMAIKRGEADIAGIHLLDEDTGDYNIPVVERYGLRGKAVLVRGYVREQGIVVQAGNPKGIRGIEDFVDKSIRIINRNVGSGTRVLLDSYLKKLAATRGEDFDEMIKKIDGYHVEAKTHSAVASAIKMGRADAGLAIRFFAERYGLGFIPLREEHFDFLISRDSLSKPAVQAFINVLRSERFHEELARRFPGLRATRDTGKIIWQ